MDDDREPQFVELVLTSAALNFCKNRESSMFFLACGSFINTAASFERVKSLAEQSVSVVSKIEIYLNSG